MRLNFPSNSLVPQQRLQGQARHMGSTDSALNTASIPDTVSIRKPGIRFGAAETALEKACDEGKIGRLKKLLVYSQQAEKDQVLLREVLKDEPNEEVVQELLKAKANPNADDGTGQTPLKVSTDRKHSAILRLMGKGPDKPLPVETVPQVQLLQWKKSGEIYSLPYKVFEPGEQELPKGHVGLGMRRGIYGIAQGRAVDALRQFSGQELTKQKFRMLEVALN